MESKNYLSDKEIAALNRLSTAFLDLAENAILFGK
jgi:hypothetical protein